MAQSLNTLRSLLLTYLWGRRIGLSNSDYLGGPKAFKHQVTDIQSTVPNTAVDNYGYIRVLTSGSSQGPTQHLLNAPEPGVEVTLTLTSTSTGSQQFGTTAAGASIFLATAGTTAGWVNLIGPGGGITLVGLSTAAWGVKGVSGSTASGAPTFTTST